VNMSFMVNSLAWACRTILVTASWPIRSKFPSQITGLRHQSLGCRVAGGLELNDHASQSLGKSIVNVTRDSIAFRRHRCFSALCGEPAELNHQHRLVRERLGEFQFFVPEGTFFGETQANRPFKSTTHRYRHEEHGNDPERQQAITERKRRHCSDVCDYAGLARAKYIWSTEG
jgi:hypothetical protein